MPPLPVLFALALIGVGALAGVNAVLGGMAIAVLAVGLWLLWLPSLSPIFAFIFLFQWLQASAKIFQGNFAGERIEELSVLGGNIFNATALSLMSLTFLAIGMRLGLGRRTQWEMDSSALRVEDRKPEFWFYCYLGAFLIASAAHSVSNLIAGLSQPLLALASLRWGFYWIFTQVAISKGGKIGFVWLICFSIELALGLVGFFSSFKTVLFFTMFGMLSSGIKLTGIRMLGLAATALLTLGLGVTWTAIKGEQRQFLNQGAATQAASVSYLDSMGNMLELVRQLDANAMVQSIEDMVDRISYVEFFGLVLDNVPASISHENGEIWFDAITRPFMPRMFFPSKSAIDDSERTAYYSGRHVSGAAEGTSISLGYVAESYIDFGAWLMIVPIVALGWMLGRFYRWIVRYVTTRGVVGVGLGSAALFQATFLESSITKLFGGLAATMLVAWVSARWVVPQIRTLSAKGTRSATRLR